MLVGKKLAAVVVGGAALAGCFAGCGDRITATKSWTLNVTETDSVAGHGLTETITGSVNGGSGAAPTAFWEHCVLRPNQPGPGRFDCVLWFNAGHKFYAASGVGALGGQGTFRSLDRDGSGGTLEVRIVGEFGNPESTFHLIAHPG